MKRETSEWKGRFHSDISVFIVQSREGVDLDGSLWGVNYRRAIRQQSFRTSLASSTRAFWECWSECRRSTEFDKCGFPFCGFSSSSGPKRFSEAIAWKYSR